MTSVEDRRIRTTRTSAVSDGFRVKRCAIPESGIGKVPIKQLALLHRGEWIISGQFGFSVATCSSSHQQSRPRPENRMFLWYPHLMSGHDGIWEPGTRCASP